MLLLCWIAMTMGAWADRPVSAEAVAGLDEPAVSATDVEALGAAEEPSGPRSEVGVEYAALTSDAIVVMTALQPTLDGARLRVDRLVAGTWEEGEEVELEVSFEPGQRGLAFLDRDVVTRARGVRLGPGGWVPLEVGVIGAACERFTGEAAVARAERAWLQASRGSWQAPPAEREDARVEPLPPSETVRCEVDGAEVQVVLPVAADTQEEDIRTVLDALEHLPPGEHFFGMHPTSPEELEWFVAGFIQAEAASCAVGVPDEGEPVIGGCWFPGGLRDDDVPRALRRAQRRGERAVKAHLTEGRTDPVRRLRMKHLGRGHLVTVEEVVPSSQTPRGAWRAGRHWTVPLFVPVDGRPPSPVGTYGGSGADAPMCVVEASCRQRLVPVAMPDVTGPPLLERLGRNRLDLARVQAFQEALLRTIRGQGE